MKSNQPSPSGELYCTCLLTPQAVNIPVQKLQKEHFILGRIPAPLPPLLPILYSSSLPSPPVPGLLPGCKHPIVLHSSLKLISNAQWIIWPVNAGTWFTTLQKTLFKEFPSNLPDSLFPLLEGIPIAYNSQPDNNLPITQPIETVNWRSLNLACFSIRYNPERLWFLSTYWREEWRRRLPRAPQNKNLLA